MQSAGRPGLGVLPVTKRRARPPARTSAWLTVTCVSYSEGGRGCGGFGPADAEPDREPLPGWAGPAGRGRPGRGRPSAGVGGGGGLPECKEAQGGSLGWRGGLHVGKGTGVSWGIRFPDLIKGRFSCGRGLGGRKPEVQGVGLRAVRAGPRLWLNLPKALRPGHQWAREQGVRPRATHRPCLPSKVRSGAFSSCLRMSNWGKRPHKATQVPLKVGTEKGRERHVNHTSLEEVSCWGNGLGAEVRVFTARVGADPAAAFRRTWCRQGAGHARPRGWRDTWSPSV